jgi:hypothetical protein
MYTPDDYRENDDYAENLPDIYTPCGNCLPCKGGCIEDCIEFGKIRFTAMMDARCMFLAMGARMNGDFTLAVEYDRLGVGTDVFQPGGWMRVPRDEYK